MIETWKHLHEKYKLPSPILRLAKDAPGTMHGMTKRHDLLKLTTYRAKGKRANFFSVRVADEWNHLPDKIKLAPTMNQFKNSLDDHWAKYKYVTPYGAFADYRVFE